MQVHLAEHSLLSALREENDRLLTENNTLKADIGYWKSRHAGAEGKHPLIKLARGEGMSREWLVGVVPTDASIGPRRI